VLHSSGDLTIKGSIGEINSPTNNGLDSNGNVVVEGNIGNITANAGFYVQSGDVTVTASGSVGDIVTKTQGIYASGNIDISGSVGNITTSGGSGSGYGIYASNGKITISGSVGDISAVNGDGIYAEMAFDQSGDVIISGEYGDIDATVGIRADGNVSLKLTGDHRIGIPLTGPADDPDSYGSVLGIQGQGSVTLTGEGSLTVYDKSTGIESGGDLTVDIGGSLTVEDYGLDGYCCLQAAGTLTVKRGTLHLTSQRSYGLSGADIAISGGKITVQTHDGEDAGKHAFNTAPSFAPAYTHRVFTGVNAAAETEITAPVATTFTESPYVRIEPVYSLTVNSGSGSGNYEAGAEVPISADIAPTGQVFDKWTGGNGGSFADMNSAATTFTMPGNAATITATYRSTGSGGGGGSDDGDDDGGTYEYTYRLTVENGTGDGTYAAGTKVTVRADAAPAGKVFDRWIGGNGGVFENTNSATTVFTMPRNSTTVTATYREQIKPVDNGGNENHNPDTGAGGTPDLPRTGDNGNMSVWFVMLITSVLGLAGFSAWHKKQQKQLATNTIIDGTRKED
jgi:hypothetical protein